MRLDGHIHIRDYEHDRDAFVQRQSEAGMDGGVILSLRPASFVKQPNWYSFEQRLNNVLEFCADKPNLYPFFWIDPTEKSAVNQVDEAVAQGIQGFKIICNRFYPGDERALPVYRAMARHEKPLLFHSGILWDGADSGIYNRPVGFESLMSISGLRFMLAHVSWPWCDECIATYGKFQNAYSSGGWDNSEMFIDVTPGTPVAYRRDVITKLFTVGYDIEDNLIFGSDSNTEDYNVPWVREWVDRDSALLDELHVPAAVQQNVFGGNLLRFLGKAQSEKVPKPLLSGV